MKYRLVSLILIVFFQNLYSQDEAARENSLNVRLGVGNATVELEDFVKYNAVSIESSVLYEISLHSPFSLEFGLSAHTLNGDFQANEASYYHTTNFVSLPVTFKAAIGNSTEKYVVGIGIKPQYLYKSKLESFNSPDGDPLISAIEDNNGGSLLVGVNMGGEITITEKAHLNFGLSLYSDAFQFGYNDNNDIIIKNFIGVYVGLGIFN